MVEATPDSSRASGSFAATPAFVWVADYEAILEDIAATNAVQTEWALLRDIIKYKLHVNIATFLSTPVEPIIGPVPPEPVGLQPSPFERPPSSSPAIPSEPTFSSSSNGLSMDTPRPPPLLSDGPDGVRVELVPENEDLMEPVDRQRELAMGLGPADVIGGRKLPDHIHEDEAASMETRLCALLDDFDSQPPFTVQRLAELLTEPQANHRALGKHLRAIEKMLLVTSEWTPPSADYASIENGSLAGGATGANGGTSSGASTPRHVNTPLFSPIPFLMHDDNMPQGEVPMSPLHLGGDEHPPSSSANVEMVSLVPSSSEPLSSSLLPDPAASSLDTDDLRVDELDAGPIPPSTLSPSAPSSSSSPSSASTQDSSMDASPSSSSNQPHLISPRPVALSSTSVFPTDPASSTITTEVNRKDTQSPPIERRVRPRSSVSSIGDAAASLLDRFVRSQSPTPDPVKLEEASASVAGEVSGSGQADEELVALAAEANGTGLEEAAQTMDVDTK